jgi:predicted ribosome quality control (RQC) complex YloA/Tae2 family protein
MEFIDRTIKFTSTNKNNPDGSYAKITFKKDCTELRSEKYGHNNVQNMQTYNHTDDPTKEKNLIFPQMFADFFQVLCSHSGSMYPDVVSLNNGGDFLRYVFKSMVVPFTKLEKENNHLRGQLESKDQELAQMKEQLESKDRELAQMKEQLERKDQEMEQMKEQLERKDQEHRSEKLKVYYDCVCEFQEEIERKDQELNETQQELNETQQELNETQQELKDTEQELNETQEQLKDTEQKLNETQQEIKTRGLLLKSCVEDLKTYAEEVEEVENKNQELEHLNHRLICETSSFVERNSYFSPEM